MREKALAYTFLILGGISMVMLAVVLIAAWHTVVAASNLFVWAIMWVIVALVLSGSLFLIGAGNHKWQMARLERQEKQQTIRHAEERQQIDVRRFDLEQHVMLTRVPADALGNYAYLLQQSQNGLQSITRLEPGNSPHAHHVQKVTEVEPIMPELPKAAALALPDIEEFYEQIAYNSLQTGLGLDMASRQLVLAPIEKSTHFKFIGGSGQGKSCVAGASLDIALTTNDPDHLRVGLLDLEHNTSRLFEDMPHVAEIGPRRQRLVGRDPDEVAQKLKLLQWELTRRAGLGESYCRQHEPLLLVYVEEMLALKYEVVDEKLKKEMLAAINILGVRGRKYLIYFLACMQTDYSDKSTREAMAQYRTRGGFAIDPDTARASGFFNTTLVKQNYQTGRPGQYVLEKPGFAGLVLAPDYDVASKLGRLDASTTRATTRATTMERESHYHDSPNRPVVVAGELSLPTAPQADVAALSPQEKRILKKYREGISINAIIASEYSDGNGKPLAGGRLFTEKTREIQALIARFLPQVDEEE